MSIHGDMEHWYSFNLKQNTSTVLDYRPQILGPNIFRLVQISVRQAYVSETVLKFTGWVKGTS